MVRALVIVIAATGCSACGDDEPDRPVSITATATRVVVEDALFHQDPRWLGGDGAYTIDLGNDRSLWLFGDSFIATSAAHTRKESAFVRNSIALMTGRDLASATMQFVWREATAPTSFFPEAGDRWFWPGGGVRLPDGPLIVFLGEIRSTPNEGLGFAGAGLRAFRVADPSTAPLTWTIEPTTAAAPPWAPTANVACTTTDNDHLVAVVTTDADHAGRLARWPLTTAGTGDLANPEWWTGMAWVPQTSLGTPPPTVIPDGATECSLHYDEPTQTWIYLWSRGFGGTTLAIRTAPALTGPWSTYHDVLKPPESNVSNAFVYAGKAHPHLRRTDGSIPVTFADNSFTFADLSDPARANTLYWPHVAHLSVLGEP
jgi:Domain of unknown function (DUF4185)